MVLLLFHLITICTTLLFLKMEIANLSKSISEAELYGAEYKVEKVTVGHAQKHMGTALRKSRRTMVREHSDGCTIGGAGRLTEQLCDDFQRYYSNTILDDLQGVIKAVKAILHYSLSTNKAPDVSRESHRGVSFSMQMLLDKLHTLITPLYLKL